MVPAPLVIAKKEQLIPHNPPAQRPAKLVVNRRRLRQSERVPCLNVLVPVKLKQTPVIVIRPAPQRHVRHRPARVPKLRVEIRRRNVHRLNRLRRRHQRRQVPVVNLVLNPFNLEVVELPPLSVHPHRQRIMRVIKLRVRPERTPHPRHEQQQSLVVPVE